MNKVTYAVLLKYLQRLEKAEDRIQHLQMLTRVQSDAIQEIQRVLGTLPR